MIRNLPASVRARLKQHADAAKEDFNLTLTRYGLERLLYRLSISPYSGNYLLKGALLFSLWYDHPHRPTRDADLLGFGPDDVGTAVAAFQNICGIAVEDGIAFDASSVRGLEIRKEAGYGGVRIDLLATLDGARVPLQVDIGFGDAVTPGPESVRYPVLLDDLPAPQLRAYPKYTVVAEKLHAICLLGMANTRMKDYFDLHVLLSEGELDAEQLRQAIQSTFERRKSAVPTAIPVGLSTTFAEDHGKQAQWGAFLKKNRLDSVKLAEIIIQIRDSIAKTGLV
ncbi:MAG TPA: nucleotidyl transferase AbiEii/AbiGii toxin family protein [Ramlibacter sp.]|nr:nucleotidyl transferase AbiEii/AbiGii toxin family protein [Ramlibacter sp.]